MKSSVPETFALYNTHTDPGQKEDISEKEPNKLKELIPKMNELWVEIRDEGPDWKKIIKKNENAQIIFTHSTDYYHIMQF